jgi:hypothetical protein
MLLGKKKSEVFHIYAMQAYRGSRGIAQFFLNLGTR